MKAPALINKPKSSDPISVLFIGKNSGETKSLYDSLKKYTKVRFIANWSAGVGDGILKALSLKPNCIVIDDEIDNKDIDKLTADIASDDMVAGTPITILKSSNRRQIVNSRVQDFIFKEGITTDRLARSIVNTVKFGRTNLYLYKSYKRGKKQVKKLLRK